MNIDDNLRIYAIASELRKLADSGVVAEQTAHACMQGAWLLESMREILFADGATSDERVKSMKDILARHQEG
jgi:hypothetical protein